VSGAGEDSRGRRRLFWMPHRTFWLFLCVSLLVVAFAAGGRLLPDAEVVKAVSQKGGQAQRRGLVLLGVELFEVGRVWTAYVTTPAWTDADMQVFEQASEIESLDVPETSISDAGIRHLKNARRLRHLSVAGTRITDGAIQTIAEIPTLEHLDLSRTQIKGHTLHLLKDIQNLRWLNISQVGLDDEGAQELQQLIRDKPSCEVKWH
jgi:hypothetical protein